MTDTAAELDRIRAELTTIAAGLAPGASAQDPIAEAIAATARAARLARWETPFRQPIR